MQKIIVIYLGLFDDIPPVRSLLNGLANQGKKIILISTKNSLNQDDGLRKKIIVKEIGEEYEKKISLLKKWVRLKKIRNEIWTLIDDCYDDESILWITSDVVVKNLGARLLKYRYVLQLYELIEKAYTLPKYKLGNLHLEKYAQKAIRVVVPEYNRAHIVKAWWGLKELPFVLENKPYYCDIEECRNLNISHSDEAKNTIEKIKDKKIILYQGIIHKERPLETFIKAVDQLGDKYAFVVMSNGENIYKNTKSSNFYFIPFVPAPYHLEITSHAYIGILSYVPVKTTNSILNAVYCAPNKTFEYSRYSIPMISNDVPALDYLFEKYKCGVCVDLDSIEAIKNAIIQIDNNYELYANNSKQYYISVDYNKRIQEILNEVFDFAR